MRPIRLLTFNTGLFQIRLFDLGIIDPVVFPDIRASHLVEGLLETDADIIALQEVFTFEHFKLLQLGLTPHYPYHCTTHHPPDIYRFKMHSGLSIFSKFPLESPGFHRYRDVPIDEAIWMDKGFQTVTVKSPLGEIALGNIHFTSGGMHRNPEAKSMVSVRNHQIDDMARVLKSLTADIRIVMGDFNAGPGSSPENYQRTIDHGFSDLFLKHPGTHEKTESWEISNPLNSREFYKNTSLQRLDHIFLDNASMDRFDIHEARIILHEPRVTLPKGKRVTLSDHYAMTAVIGRKGQD